MSIDERVDQQNVIQAHNRILFRLKKEGSWAVLPLSSRAPALARTPMLPWQRKLPPCPPRARHACDFLFCFYKTAILLRVQWHLIAGSICTSLMLSIAEKVFLTDELL